MIVTRYGLTTNPLEHKRETEQQKRDELNNTFERVAHLEVDIFYIVTGSRASVTVMDVEEERSIKQHRNADNSVQFVIQSLSMH